MSDLNVGEMGVAPRGPKRFPRSEGRRVLSARTQLLLADPPHIDEEHDDESADAQEGLEPRGERRRQIDPTTCERDYSGDEIEFMRAMDDYKRKCGRPFPTWSEVLEVVRSLGYHRD